MKLAGVVGLCVLFVGSWTIQSSHVLAQDEPADIQFDQDIEFDMEEFEGFGEEDFGAAETTREEEAAIALIGTTMIIVIVLATIVGLLLTGIAAYMLSDALSAIPEKSREISPMIPWLLFVPVVNIVVLFIAFIKVPDSLRAALESAGNTTQGDCGKALGLWGAVASLIGCFMPVGLILLFMSLARINRAKHAFRSAPAA